MHHWSWWGHFEVFKWGSGGFSDGASLFMEGIVQFYDYILGFTMFVFWFVAILVLLELRYGSGDRDGGGVLLIEVVWTLLPMIVLVFMAYPSMVLLYADSGVLEPSVFVGVTGYQWYWVYQGGLEGLSSYMLSGDDGYRMLDVDNRLVVAGYSRVMAVVSSGDVIHSWALPSLGLKVDCIPGRLNQVSFNVLGPGIYYGQCSELCGIMHSFMPIVVESVVA